MITEIKFNKPKLTSSIWFNILLGILISVGWLYVFIFLPFRTIDRWLSKEEPAETQIVQEISQEQLMEDQEKIKNFYEEIININDKTVTIWKKTIESTAIDYVLYQELKDAQNMMSLYSSRIRLVKIPDLANDIDENSLKNIVSYLDSAYSYYSFSFSDLAESLDTKNYKTKKLKEDIAIVNGLEARRLIVKATAILSEVRNKYNLINEVEETLE